MPATHAQTSAVLLCIVVVLLSIFSLFCLKSSGDHRCSSTSKRRILARINRRPKILHVVPEARRGGGWSHCIIPAHVLGIKAAVAHFASLCLAALLSVLLCAALIVHCWSFSHRQGMQKRNRMEVLPFL